MFLDSFLNNSVFSFVTHHYCFWKTHRGRSRNNGPPSLWSQYQFPLWLVTLRGEFQKAGTTEFPILSKHQIVKSWFVINSNPFNTISFSRQAYLSKFHRSCDALAYPTWFINDFKKRSKQRTFFTDFCSIQLHSSAYNSEHFRFQTSLALTGYLMFTLAAVFFDETIWSLIYQKENLGILHTYTEKNKCRSTLNEIFEYTTSQYFFRINFSKSWWHWKTKTRSEIYGTVVSVWFGHMHMLSPYVRRRLRNLLPVSIYSLLLVGTQKTTFFDSMCGSKTSLMLF